MALRDHLTAAGVLLGSLVLVGPLTYAVVAVAVDAALSAAGVGTHPLRLAAFVVPLALALYTASEVAELQLHGTAALWRGTRRDVFLRHAVLSVVTLAGLLEAGLVALASLVAALDGRFADPLTVDLVGALAVLVIVAVWGTLMVFGFGVREGYRRAAG